MYVSNNIEYSKAGIFKLEEQWVSRCETSHTSGVWRVVTSRLPAARMEELLKVCEGSWKSRVDGETRGFGWTPVRGKGEFLSRL